MRQLSAVFLLRMLLGVLHPEPIVLRPSIPAQITSLFWGLSPSTGLLMTWSMYVAEITLITKEAQRLMPRAQFTAVGGAGGAGGGNNGGNNGTDNGGAGAPPSTSVAPPASTLPANAANPSVSQTTTSSPASTSTPAAGGIAAPPVTGV